MPYNGSGTYTPPAADFPAITQTVISSSKYNNTINDVAAALTNAVTRDGQSPMTAALPMGGWPITGIALGSLSAPSISFTGLSGTGFSATASSLNMSLNGSPKVYLTATGLGVNITPNYEFSLSGASSILNMEMRNNSSLGLVGNASFFRFSDPSGTKVSLGVPGDGNFEFQIYTNMSRLTLYTNNAEQMRIDNVGRVGIGTTSPGYKLDVRGVTASGNGTITTGFTYDTRGLVGTFSNHALGFITNGTAPTMLLDTSGNLGIGTNSPATKLHIDTATAGYGLTLAASTLTARTYRFGLDSNANLALFDSTAAAVRLTLDTSGNLALGQTSAVSRLDVLSGVDVAIRARTSNNNEVLRVESTGTTTANIRFINTAANNIYIGSDSGALTFTTNNTERMRIAQAGNVTVNAPSSGGITLTVNTASGGNAQSWFDGTREGLINFTTNAMQFGATTNHALDLSSNNTVRVRVPAIGGFVVGTAALATTATDGFLYVPTCAGVPTGTPAAQTGTAPIVVNTTNNKLYFYSGGAWRDAGP